jgi:glycosyltransferase involved in cell wall biosynthesis
MELLPAEVPVVVTMHGLENFTGGCSYTRGCTGFHRQCGDCPQLGAQSPNDLSAKEWRIRNDAFSLRKKGNLHFVADSHWMAAEARKSNLLREFPVSVIYYGIDTEIFRPLDRSAAHGAFDIPAGTPVLGFAADSISDERKGIRYLLAALQGLQKKPFLLTWGRDRAQALDTFPGLHLGHLDSEHLAAFVYNACDVFVMPSVEEAFGQTALEAQACGTPVAAFAAGGIPEVVQQEETGLLAPVGDVEKLRGNISRLLSDKHLRKNLGEKGAFLAVEKFSFRANAEQYTKLYAAMLRKKGDA